MRTFALVFILATAAAAQPTTWIVDEQGGPGAHFTDIAPAVAAAADGDTVLIRTGTYGGFATGKALMMLGEGSVTIMQELSLPIPGGPPVVQITGVPGGKAFIAKNLQIDFFQFGTGLAITDNAGRVHLEEVGVRLLTFPAQDGTAVSIARSTLVTWTGGDVVGRPGVSASDAALVFGSMSIRGDSACSGAICATWPAHVGMQVSRTRVWLSRTDVTGGSGSFLPIWAGMNPAEAIRSSASSLAVTGDNATLITAGGNPSGAGSPASAISTSGGGSVDVDTEIRVFGSGAPDIAGTATVVRRRIISLAGQGGPPGGNLQVSAVSPAGDLVHLIAGLPADPIPHPAGTVFINPLVVLPLFVGTQGASGSTELNVPIPNSAALRGAAIAMQAGNLYFASSRVEFSNPVVVVLH